MRRKTTTLRSTKYEIWQMRSRPSELQPQWLDAVWGVRFPHKSGKVGRQLSIQRKKKKKVGKSWRAFDFQVLHPHQQATIMSKGKNKGKGPRKSQEGLKLDDKVLEQLTAKIDQNLNGKELKRKQPPTNVSSKQDQKRQRNSVNGKDKQQKPSAKGKGKGLDQAAIMAEIKELGGDEKDWDLIKDIDSSDEEYVNDDKKAMDKGLKDELAALSKQLGLADYQPSEASEEEDQGDEVDEDEGEEDDDQIDEEAEESESEEEQEEAPKPQKKPGDMVCLVSMLKASSDS